MRICLFEDAKVRQLSPANLTRPTFELRCGWTSLFEKQTRPFQHVQLGAIVRPHLAAICSLQYPDMIVNNAEWLGHEPMVWVNSRWLPDSATIQNISSECVGVCAAEAAYVVAPPTKPASAAGSDIDAWLADCCTRLPHVPAGGRMVHHLWDLVHANAEQIHADFEALERKSDTHLSAIPEHVSVVGPRDELIVHPSAKIDPLVVADTTKGPVIIEQDAVIAPFTRLEGPCVIGAGTHILGANIRHGTTFGPECRIGGEVEETIIQGYTNKAHHGFLGHSYVGEWVNLGAGTCNSDLRNDYAEISVIVNDSSVATGQRKVGCFLGDHVKTGLNVVLNTGASVGAFCNLLPSGGYPPKYVPSFCNWWNGRLADNASPERLLETAAVVMSRRGLSLSSVHADLCHFLFEDSAAERQQAVRGRRGQA